jgi:hypothetical protein
LFHTVSIMASRGVASVPVFYVSESGVAYQLADENERVDHDVEESRVRLANILRSRRQQQQRDEAEAEKNSTNLREQSNDADGTDGDDNDWEDVESDEENAAPVQATVNYAGGTDLALRRAEAQHQRLANSLVDRERQLKMNKLLARGARMSKKTANASKAIASQFHYREKPADNAAARAVVHHTGSHYHMAGGVQFQRGVRVKGVVSRHSKQGAKIQAARIAKRNMYAAREDARGERAEGVRSQGRTNTSKKKKQQKQDV